MRTYDSGLEISLAAAEREALPSRIARQPLRAIGTLGGTDAPPGHRPGACPRQVPRHHVRLAVDRRHPGLDAGLSRRCGECPDLDGPRRDWHRADGRAERRIFTRRVTMTTTFRDYDLI
jgi:hypothetical protein